MGRTTTPTAPLAEQLAQRAERKEAAGRKQEGRKDGTPSLLLYPSGSTLLNLACSDQEHGGYPAGALINVVGDKSAGKSMLALSGLAEIAISPEFRGVRLVYDDAEASLGFDMSHLFGRKASERIELPDPVSTIEGYTDRVHDLLGAGEAFVHVLDSFDMIGADADSAKYEATRKAKEGSDGKKVKGSYKMGRAKGTSELFRMKKKAVRDTNSLLIIVSQVRENLDASGPWSPKYVRAGGKALDHTAQVVLWLAAVKQLKRTVKGRERAVGQLVEAKITKNKVTGKLRTVRFPVYYDYGVDDIGSIVDFLVEEGHWKKGKGGIAAGELDISDSRDGLIKGIEQRADLIKRVRKLAGVVWREIEDDFRLDRKRRFE